MNAARTLDRSELASPATALPGFKLRVVPSPADWRREAATAYRRSDWQADATAAYRTAEHDERARLIADLTLRLLDLTGQMVNEDAIYVDRGQRLAQATVDGERFRLKDGSLSLMRSCLHCGIGEFASPSIRTRADLGYALSIWEPYHPDCEPADPAEW